MDQLYRKRTYPSGAVRYEPTGIMDTGSPADGIWYVHTTKHGRSMHKIQEHLEDLPRARTIAELEPMRGEICKAILDIKLETKKYDGVPWITIPCANDICTRIFERLAERIEQCKKSGS